jgi:alanine racemase
MRKDGPLNWVEVDLSAIQQNYSWLRKTVGVPVMAVVKANAYGHGLKAVGEALQAAGADAFGVARMEEALALREAGVRSPILVLGYTPPENVPLAVEQGVRLAVFDEETAREYAERALGCGKRLRVHAKVDTGMGRLGVLPDRAVGFLQALRGMDGLEVEGLFTHFARADEPGVDTTERQIRTFDAVVAELDALGLRPPWVHAANSAGALFFPDSRYDLVRCGIALYGINPSAGANAPRELRPALSWKCQLVSIKELPPGHGVSYNHLYFTRKKERIGVIACGYADGLRRTDGNRVLIRGKRVPIVGAVCMDQSMVQLDEVPDAQVGDEAVLIGTQGEESIEAGELARTWNTNAYEVVCGIGSRIPRQYPVEARDGSTAESDGGGE